MIFALLVLAAILIRANQIGTYLFKVNNGNTRAMCDIYSKLEIKAPERMVSLLLNLNRFQIFSLFCRLHCCFEQVNAGRVDGFF